VQGELFADATTKFAALGGTWRTLHAGNVQVGIAPAASGLTGYVAYTLYTPRLAVNVGDRVWSPQVVDAEDTLPNSRQLRGTVDYTVTRTGKVHFAYASMVQGGFPLRTYALGYVQRMGGLDLHADVTETVAFGTTRAGLAAYFSLPLGNGTTLSGANNAFNAISQNPTTPKQQRMSTDFGAQYALNFGDGTSLTNATFSSRAAGSTARLNVSRFGGHVSLNSEFSGSLVFLGGKALATNEVIDQDSALDALNGRSAATLIAVNESGQWLSAGTIVRAATDVGQWRVGPDGRVDIDDIGAGPQTLVVTSRTANCIIAIVVPPNATNAYDLGTQVCRKTQQL
jgi:outer membrane usher protein FimD/PapC